MESNKASTRPKLSPAELRRRVLQRVREMAPMEVLIQVSLPHNRTHRYPSPPRIPRSPPPEARRCGGEYSRTAADLFDEFFGYSSNENTAAAASETEPAAGPPADPNANLGLGGDDPDAMDSN